MTVTLNGKYDTTQFCGTIRCERCKHVYQWKCNGILRVPNEGHNYYWNIAKHEENVEEHYPKSVKYH